jgi:Xaa-Pro aminopeptidase
VAKTKSRKPPAHIAARLQACRAKIQQKSLDGYLVTNTKDQLYLTGFDGEDGAVLILPGTVYLLTDGRFEEAAERQAPWAKAVIRKKSIAKVLNQLLRKHHVDRLGFQPNEVTVAEHKTFRRELKPVRLIALPKVTRELRLYKDQQEVSAIQKALRVGESAFQAVLDRIRPGMTERQVAALLLYEMLDRGASGAAFPSIVAAGPSSSQPHARPGNRKIKEGQPLLIDWGATVGHYNGDLTRVVFIRRIPPRFRRLYEQVLEAQTKAIEAVRPGVRMADVDAVARNHLQKADLARYFAHSLGHGLGLDVHEAPSVAPRVEQILKPGMVITVEPGVYFPGKGGIRIEDDVLVTERGHRVLSNLPKGLEAATL